MDERRRRRLAVAEGAGADTSDPGEEKSLPDCVPAEWCAAAPWIPRSRWKLWTLTCLFLAGVSAVLIMTWRTPDFRPELAPALDPLFRGPQPKLIAYLGIILWTLSGQLSLLIGWHRSHSRLDFRGRYRLWPWAATTMFASGLCIATDLHLGLGALLSRWEFFAQQRPALAWMLPATCLLLPTWLLIDRDVRRSLASLILLRLTVLVFLCGAAASTYGSLWIEPEWIPVIESVCGLLGPAMLTVSLWIHGWYVAYITPDPPAATPWKMPGFTGAILRWCLGWLTWPFRRRAAAEPDAAASTRRRRKSDEAGTTTKRKRKTKRKPRTRKAVEEEEAEEEEYAEDESSETDEESSDDEESYGEEEEEQESTPARVTAPAAKSDQRSSGYGDQRRNATSQQQQQVDDEDDDEDDEGGEQWRADGPPAEQLKGLSKRQRRALIKQHRDQQRASGGR